MIEANADVKTSSDAERRAARRNEYLRLLGHVSLLYACGGLFFILYRRLTNQDKQPSNLDLTIDISLVAALIMLLFFFFRATISSVRTVTPTIPDKDRVLLEKLIVDENEKAIALYVQLASLGGATGTATKLGLTGLPLATVGLTVFFALIGLFKPEFLELAKLTLGAFIGSFVQRRVSTEAIERAVRGGSATGGRPISPSQPEPASFISDSEFS
jgi:hypothetical protein